MDSSIGSVVSAKGLSIVSPQGKEIIKDLNLSINPGAKLAIIGAEGVGKSTIIKALCGMKLPGFKVSGNIMSGNVGYLAQHLEDIWQETSPVQFLLATSSPVPDEMLDWNAYSAACKALSNVGLSPDLLNEDRPLSTLSGGESVRIRLAKLLMREPDILLLDEPTNYLDLDTMEWLETYILDDKRAIAFVTHDEKLIERTANQILFIQHFDHSNKSRYIFSGSDYKTFLDEKESVYQRVETAARKQRSENRKLKQEYAEAASKSASRTKKSSASAEGAAEKSRGMRASQQSTNKLARLKERIEETSEVETLNREEDALLDFSKEALIPQGKVILKMEGKTIAHEDRVLATNIDLCVIGPQKVVIIGANGVGKSTFLKEIYGELKKSNAIAVEFLPQNPEDILTETKRTAIEYLDDVNTDKTFTRTILGRLGFHRNEMGLEIGSLSGGQRLKILLGRLICSNANVLLMDEPTANLSPLASPNLRDALRRFPGAVIAVSHDRKFIEEVATDVYELTPNGLQKRPLLKGLSL